jgi:hypothetical protein
MTSWWASLSGLTQSFYLLAIFFSTLFGWQFVAALSAVGGDGDMDADGGDGVGDGAPDGVEDFDTGDMDGADEFVEDPAGLATFRLLSFRSVLAFGTLFSWAGALYLQQDMAPAWALFRALLWGFTGMVVVGAFFWILPRLTEEGTSDLETAVGQTGSVYLRIPPSGTGQVKVVVSGRVSFVRAQSEDGEALPAGTTVYVVRKLDPMTLEVEPVYDQGD